MYQNCVEWDVSRITSQVSFDVCLRLFQVVTIFFKTIFKNMERGKKEGKKQQIFTGGKVWLLTT